jgi:predicted DNA-binding transcriptional regulator AlpA
MSEAKQFPTIQKKQKLPRSIPGPLRTMPLPEIGFLRITEVLRLYPVSRSSWWQGIRDGKYPAPIKLGPRTSAWKISDILALIAQAEAGSCQ